MAWLLRRRPAPRWVSPLAAASVFAVVGVGAAAAASADDHPVLPPRTAEQLLADVMQPTTTALSGTVAVHSDLGLPDLGGLAGFAAPAPGSGVVPDDAASLAPDATSAATDPALGTLLGLVAGDSTLRVWRDGPERQRVAILADSAETDLVHDGTDAWLWRSDSKQVVHATLPAPSDLPSGDSDSGHGRMPGLDELSMLDGLDGHRLSDLPSTPQEAAAAILAAASDTTDITSGDTTRVAGRDSYQLVVTPTTPGTLVGRIAVAIDSETHVPLRLEVYPAGHSRPALSIGFTDVSFATPDAGVFAFTPPDGATVTEVPGDDVPAALGKPDGHDALDGRGETPGDPSDRPAVTTVGEAWATVVVVTPQDGSDTSSDASSDSPEDAALSLLTPVSGEWGSGHALAGTLFSVLVADDGRIAAGAVPVKALEDALAQASS